MLYATQVRTGARALDVEDPRWRRYVNTNVLALHDTTRCVQGQLHGDYNSLEAEEFRNRHSDAPEDDQAYELGFSLRPGPFITARYALLTWRWRREVRRGLR